MICVFWIGKEEHLKYLVAKSLQHFRYFEISWLNMNFLQIIVFYDFTITFYSIFLPVHSSYVVQWLIAPWIYLDGMIVNCGLHILWDCECCTTFCLLVGGQLPYSQNCTFRLLFYFGFRTLSWLGNYFSWHLIMIIMIFISTSRIGEKIHKMAWLYIKAVP